MGQIIDIFSQHEVKTDTDIYCQDSFFYGEYLHKSDNPFQKAVSDISSASAKLVIDGDLDTFDEHLEELKKAIIRYENLKKQL
ncbi:hypothetical protein ACFL36_01245 [Thermodesulfobacteriota bacterium]